MALPPTAAAQPGGVSLLLLERVTPPGLCQRATVPPVALSVCVKVYGGGGLSRRYHVLAPIVGQNKTLVIIMVLLLKQLLGTRTTRAALWG